MELAPLFLLLLLPPADATGEMASALQASLRAELGDVTMAVAPDRLVTPAMFEGENPPYRARFVAHVSWAGKDKANIEMRSGPGAKATSPYQASRVVSFAARDRKSERGRAIGLVIAGLLRDSPPEISGVAATPPVPEPTRTGVAFGALFGLQRVRSGTWAAGPVLFFDLPLPHDLALEISTGVLAASKYWQVPTGVEARWRFLRSSDESRALVLGLGGILLRESASVSPGKGEESRAVGGSLWNVGVVASLSGHVTLGRSLRLLALVGVQALARSMSTSLTEGEDRERTTTTTVYSRWRPAFGLGLAYSM